MANQLAIPIIILTFGCLTVTSFAQENSPGSDDPLLSTELDFYRRPHDAGLGKRVYVAQFKRLPVYDFGLGKRSHMYNFGLGKRSEIVGDGEESAEYDEYPYTDDDVQIPDLDLYHDDEMQTMDKRQKLYSFGLGKRGYRYDFGLGKRGHRYDFGLGKRSQSNREKAYNFGLGKRTRLYSFGLGKRPYIQGPLPSRFNFGLGKRSEDFDISKNIISKREVNEQILSDANHSNDENQASTESTQTSTNQNKKPDNTIELESHEIMAHSGKSPVSKRSSYRYSYENGKNSAYRMNTGFSRQFRKPLYSFGLGKRTSNNELKSDNLKTAN